MKKQVIFSILFLSWISGVSLACFFHPVPDYQSTENHSSSISLDESPKVHQILNSGFGVTFGDHSVNFSAFVQENVFFLNDAFELLTQSIGKSAEIRPHFNSRILLAAFFETW
ncbi:hypothetical protein [Algoriphagus litoralis]|uniref:hypothetical protein n=1 Tax=Algoriphagus litoralis TaxID=2202829 RepID=UPI000DB9AA39|nr:hypothetical protein [Algoriphagus litoralis]